MPRENRRSFARTPRRGRLLVLLALSGVLSPNLGWSQGWMAVCSAQGPIQPSELGSLRPIPRQGMWELKAFGDAETFELRVGGCGEKLLPGGAAYEKRGQTYWVELDRQSDGTYTGTKEGIITWNLTPESEELITGLMIVAGRRELVEMSFVAAAPPLPEALDCECESVRGELENLRAARESYVHRLSQAQLGQTSTSTQVDAEVDADLESGGDVEVSTGWGTNTRTCRITEGDLTGYPTRRSYEVVWRAGHDHESMHRDRCCRMHREQEAFKDANPDKMRRIAQLEILQAGGLSPEEQAEYTGLLAEIPQTYEEWNKDPVNSAQDEIDGYDVAIPILEQWLQQNCH